MIKETVRDHRIVSPIILQDIIFSFIICFITTCVFVFLDSKLIHGCIIPVFLCGVIIGVDAMRWFRGGVDTFDPKGIIGMFGLNFFFLAPLLTVYYNTDIKLGGGPPDWRPWIGIMGWLNLAGIILYQISQRFAFKHICAAKKYWVPIPGKSLLILWASVFICIVCWFIFMAKMGGIAGIVEEQLYRVGSKGGLGFARMFATATMPLFLMAITLHRQSNTRVSLINVGVLLLICAVVQFVASGFSGSRRIIMYPIVWAVGIVHYYWRDLSSKLLLLAMVPMLAFAFIYGLYKAGGERFIDIFRGGITLSELVGSTNESFAGVLVGDISRADIQAWMIYKWKTSREDYDLRYGETYLEAPVTLRPRWLFPGKAQGSEKVRAASEFVHGKGYFDPSRNRFVGKVYGLGGEAILNFGIWAIPFPFAFWGFCIGYLRRKWISWPADDSRLLIMPFLTILVLLTLLSDSDNCWNSIIGHLIVPAFVVFLISFKGYFVSESWSESQVMGDYVTNI